MSTELFPYEYVPAGFEIVIDLGSNAEYGSKGEIVPGSKGGIWNLWWNITLSDNPQTWDEEVKEWLAACLLKTLKDNQRWLKAPELIDNYPEATSWLTELSGR
jgi:hypothetical protein